MKTVHNLFVMFLFFIISDVCAKEYYIDQNGNDNNDGSIIEPWATLRKANKNLQAGDTVILNPGIYTGVIYPKNSGESNKPIIYRALKRRTVILTGPRNKLRTSSTVHIENVSFIKIQGLIIKPDTWFGRWVYIKDTNHVEIKDVHMDGCKYKSPFQIVHSSQITLRDSELRRHYGSKKDIGNMAVIGHSSKIVIEGNSFSKAGHSLLQFHPHGSNKDIVIRGNVFHSGWGRNFGFFGVNNILFENNIITNAYDGGHSADTQSKFLVNHGIFRFNKIFNNWGIPLSGNPYNKNLFFQHVRLYGNIFHSNYSSGFLIGGPVEKTKDVIFKNNIFWNNDQYGSGNQVRIKKGAERDIVFQNNIISSEKYQGNNSIWFDGVERSKRPMNVNLIQQNFPDKFTGNLNEKPYIKKINRHNYLIDPNSNLIDSGQTLSRTVGSGAGTIIPVTDALAFFDGYDIENEVGDRIAIGIDKQTTRIINVDYKDKILHVDVPVTWKDKDAVSLPWSGRATDIGMHEYGKSDKEEVIVKSSAYKTNVGELVLFDAHIQGIEPAKITWLMGDGTILEGGNIAKRYSIPGEYAVHVKVTGKNGKQHYGVNYIKVEKESRSLSPFLVNTTFDIDDKEWWWRWQVYRPNPAAFKIEEGGNSNKRSLHVYAPKNKGRLPARIYPTEWDLDKYPYITMKYRISPGTPIAVYLLGFETGADSKQLCVAKVPGSGLCSKKSKNMIILKDDNLWHVLNLDVRIFNDIYPEATRIKGFKLEAVNRNMVKKGHEYWIDDFSISSDQSKY